MNLNRRSALNAYAQTGIEQNINNASPHKLITLLFEGALNAIATAKGHMQRNEIAEKGKAITKAIAIIDEGLKVSLDIEAGGELAQNLNDLYEYMCVRLLISNLKNDQDGLDEVAQLLSGIKEAWDSIGEPATQAANVATEPTPPEMPPQRSAARVSYGKA